MNDDKKPWWKSKTIWANAVLAAVSSVPQFREFASQNPEAVSLGAAALNVALRAVTKSKLGK